MSIDEVKEQFDKIATALEDGGYDELGSEFVVMARELNAATISEVEVSSWADFQRFWNNNRGTELVFMFIDKYGSDSSFVKKAKSLVEQANKLDEELHGFYMELKGIRAKQDAKVTEESKKKKDVEESLESLEEK